MGAIIKVNGSHNTLRASIIVELGNGVDTFVNPDDFPEAYEAAAKMLREGWSHSWAQIWWEGRGKKRKGQFVIELFRQAHLSPS